MKKIAISMVFLGLGSIFAESIEEEIQRLEKENQLLELKQKNKQLTIDLEKGKVTHSKNTIKIKDDTKKKEKNGLFLGVEAELGSFEFKINFLDDPEDLIIDSHPATFNGGLLFGYQHYFGENARHGIKISSHLYSGVGYGKTFKDEKSSATQTFIPIKFGLDVKYAWDFLEKQNHLLGLNVGLGYEVDYYFSKIFETYYKARTSEELKEDLEIKNDFEKTYSDLIHGTYFTIGLHYLLKKHHLFEANYRFGGIFGLGKTKQTIYNGIPDGYFSFNTQSYLTLSYAYKF